MVPGIFSKKNFDACATQLVFGQSWWFFGIELLKKYTWFTAICPFSKIAKSSKSFHPTYCVCNYWRCCFWWMVHSSCQDGFSRLLPSICLHFTEMAFMIPKWLVRKRLTVLCNCCFIIYSIPYSCIGQHWHT